MPTPKRPSGRKSLGEVTDALNELHDSGVVNLDINMRDMLAKRESLGRLGGVDEVASSIIAWDGYGLVIASALNDPAQLKTISNQLRELTGGGK